MSKNKFIRIILFFVILSGVGFYQPIGLSDELAKLFYYVACLLFVWIVALKKQHVMSHYSIFSTEYTLVLIGIISSVFMSFFYQNQPFLIGVMTTIPSFTYALYFVLKKSDVQKSLIEKYIFVFAVLGMLIMLVNLLSFPNIIFGQADIDIDRAGIRIRIPGFSFICLGFFLFIYKYHLTSKKKWILLSIVSYIFILLSLTRQVILVATILGCWFVFSPLKLFKRVIVIVSIATVFFLVFPHIEFAKKMLTLTQEQIYSNKHQQEDVRLGAWRFYTTELQPNIATHILGCGVPSAGNSEYGSRIEKEWESTRYFAVDVGYAGFYFYFGAIATIGLVILLVKGSFFNKRKKDIYANYYLLTILITSFASGPILYYDSIIAIVLSTYILTIRNDNRNCNIKL